MKKAFIAFAVVGALVFSTGAHAQTQAPKFKNFVGTDEQKSVQPSGDISETDVNIRAVRAFSKTYPAASGVSWSELDGTYFVHFDVDGVKHKVAFGKNGEAEYALKIYNASQVPSTIIKNMKLNYYDYEVKGAQELTIGSKRVQIVQLAGLKNWKTIRIADGEIEEIQNLREQ